MSDRAICTILMVIIAVQVRKILRLREILRLEDQFALESVERP